MQAKYLLFLFSSAVQATKVLLPLYIYPSWQGWWNNVFAAVGANPNVTFQIILNPLNGPGGTTPGYNSDWVAGVSRLNSYRNVHTLGYVHTSYNARDRADVEADVAAWAGWNAYVARNISVNGIFFDEVPNWATPRNGKNDVAYMANLTAYSKAQFGARAPRFQTIYNVGTKSVHPEYFTQADYVVSHVSRFRLLERMIYPKANRLTKTPGRSGAVRIGLHLGGAEH